MSSTKDITTRVLDAFLQRILDNVCYTELANPVRSLLDSGVTLKPDDLIMIYERTYEQLPEGKQSQ